MKVILFGATGMVGRGVLLECLEDSGVSHILAIGRRATEVQHVKLTEILHDDFSDYSGIGDDLAGFDACFFCLGVSSLGMSETRYRHITYDFTLAAARALSAINPALVFCYVSGEGADSSETGRVMWARVRVGRDAWFAERGTRPRGAACPSRWCGTAARRVGRTRHSPGSPLTPDSRPTMPTEEPPVQTCAACGRTYTQTHLAVSWVKPEPASTPASKPSSGA